MHVIDFRYKLMDLKLNLGALKEEINHLIEVITDEEDPSSVNIGLFLQVLDKF